MTYLSTPLRYLAVSPIELSLPATLKCGQAFRWTSRPATKLSCDVKLEEGVEWLGALSGRTLVLRQDANGVFYRAFYPKHSTQEYEEDLKGDTTANLLRRYFVLDVNLASLISQWEKKDSNFVKKTKGGRYGGIRVLKQDPWEALLSFICSSNNNIGRITLMLHRICKEYGSALPLEQYSFPTPESLADDEVEERLRELGFGYRAPYVVRTAQMLTETSDPHATLEAIAAMPTPQEQREALTAFAGVGPKVADCVRLFGLGQSDVVPVDVHIARLAVRDYAVKGFKEGSKDSYEVVQKALKQKWGPYAGWAQQILFSVELGSAFEPAKTVEIETPLKRKSEEEAYPTPVATPVAKAMALAVELVEAIHPKEEELDACTSPAERSKLRKRRKVR